MLPTLFISHGSPMLALEPSPARDFLAGLGMSLPRPQAIVIASAHWDTPYPAISAVETNDTIHDFYGFPPALYAMRYPAPGDSALAQRIETLLRDAGLNADLDSARGLDHGAWVPLSLIYPEHDIPVLQVSLQAEQGPEHHLLLGQALTALPRENILVIGSGTFTHDLGRLRRATPDVAPAPDVVAFADWMHAALQQNRTGDLLAYRSKAPHAAAQHPTDEHLMPIFVALGAAGGGARATRLHASTRYGTLRMDAYAFVA
ncbi:MAG TPA: class III extradiol ring-cleavage dioxygenase [Acetobacteraceae bacterium]|jgi:4,5-DOPA dioxygenase extradiol|nr:class III extradiol ring-cleavage dioxygenase [Acetobacteraceae bacterium]